MRKQKTAIIIGAGPAGLTAAYELLARTDIQPIIFEQNSIVGGISQTLNYKGNRMDIGGHRFFSKSQRIIDWWLNILPLQKLTDNSFKISYHRQQYSSAIHAVGPDPDQADQVMLLRQRRSHIYYRGKFFEYPITMSWDTIQKLGISEVFLICCSYLKTIFSPLRPERNLEQFFINRFGRRLYQTFFKTYTEKVWGLPCDQISAQWGAQRVKGLSTSKTIRHAVKKIFKQPDQLQTATTETSLIEYFLYPKLGPGQMWETVANTVKQQGGQVYTQYKVIGLQSHGTQLTSVLVQDSHGKITQWQGDYFFSTMPVNDLIVAFGSKAPAAVVEVASGLPYRGFITVGLLVKKLKSPVADNWIYIHEPNVKIGRLQVYNNWSPYLVNDPNTVWLGLEYFSTVGDTLWKKNNSDFIQFAIGELVALNWIDEADVIDGTVIRVPKAYPAYFGTYDQFDKIRTYTDQYANLFLLGRNGMHRYNNQDHSMLTAMQAVDNILAGVETKDNLWAVNTEDDYHEEKL